MNKELQSIKDLIIGKSGSSHGVNQVMGEIDEGEGHIRQEEEAQAFGEFQSAVIKTVGISSEALKNTLHSLEQRMTAYMQSNDQRANSHGVSLKKIETQLAQLLDTVVKQNKGKSPSTNEHINVLKVVEEEVEKVVGPEIISNQVRVLDHSTKVEVDNMVKGTKNVEWEKG
ncbi:hypothetical protein Q3G72_030750 [Acer saccharum]|nr:hypothetical protein Q3G72_030750 [Acer saccharum]